MLFSPSRTRRPPYARSWRRYLMPIPRYRILLFFFLPVCAQAQSSTEFKQILDRLTRLEEENRTLANEVHELREQLAASHFTATPGAAPAALSAAEPTE